MDWDGSDIRRLTSDDLRGGYWGFVHSSWSGDGTRIVTQDGGSGYPGIWVLQAGGGGEQNISNHGTDEAIARFSPSGDVISWSRVGIGTMLWTTDGSEPSAIPTFVDWASWSPDGELLAGWNASSDKLLVMGQDGTIQAEIDAPVQMSFPSWQRRAP